MAFHIVWNKERIVLTEGEVLVSTRKRFSPRDGSVTPPAAGQHVIRVTPPMGIENTEKLAENLADCYDAVLRQAALQGWHSIRMPLIGAKEPRIPRELELQAAAEAIRTFLDRCDMEIYLVMDDPRSAEILQMLTDVDAYLSRMYPDDEEAQPQQWQEEKFFPLFIPEFEEEAEEENPDTAELGAIVQDMQQPVREPDLEEYPEPSAPPILGDYAAGPCNCYAGAASVPSQASYSEELEEYLRKADAGFSETLLSLIDKTGKKDSDIYNRANISRQLFSKIRNDRNYRPTKQTALAFAIALELDLPQTQDFIGRAGYVLNKSSKFDLILTYFIDKKWYNVVDINIALLEFDQKLLGG